MRSTAPAMPAAGAAYRAMAAPPATSSRSIGSGSCCAIGRGPAEGTLRTGAPEAGRGRSRVGRRGNGLDRGGLGGRRLLRRGGSLGGSGLLGRLRIDAHRVGGG